MALKCKTGDVSVNMFMTLNNAKIHTVFACLLTLINGLKSYRNHILDTCS